MFFVQVYHDYGMGGVSLNGGFPPNLHTPKCWSFFGSENPMEIVGGTTTTILGWLGSTK